MKQQPLTFPDWKESIAREPMSPALRTGYTREIINFLKHCKQWRAPATVELAKQYLLAREQVTTAPAREALRWFFRAGRKSKEQGIHHLSMRADEGVASPTTTANLPVASFRKSEPGLAARDLGGADWERDLIKASRERNFLWRTEETYRGWAARFAKFLAPKSPDAAGGAEVAAFLSMLAVELRASPSTQKQALNALVFVTKRPEMRAPRLFTLRFASGQPLTQTAG